MQPPKKRPKTEAEYWNATARKLPSPDALQEIMRRSQQIEAIRLRAIQIQENAQLDLALALLETKDSLNLSWDALSKKFIGACNSSQIYRIVNRTGTVRGTTYNNVCLTLNQIRESNGLNPIIFIQWQEVD